ncbi:MAG: hypothetical protein MHPSP_002708 [Paramarteilia canceri]
MMTTVVNLNKEYDVNLICKYLQHKLATKVFQSKKTSDLIIYGDHAQLMSQFLVKIGYSDTLIAIKGQTLN